VSSYSDQLGVLLPPGRIFSRRADSVLRKLLEAFAVLLQAAEVRAFQLLVELDPQTTYEALPEWEALLGLPDPCAPAAQTFQERRARVVQKYTRQPRPTLEYIAELASDLGYFGTVLTEDALRFQLVVSVPNPRVVLFRAGVSRCGDLLGKIDRAADLECLLGEVKPAHVTLVFDYSGV
jgi:uncharacterized protein YmfQ (DUF2313 family)